MNMYNVHVGTCTCTMCMQLHISEPNIILCIFCDYVCRDRSERLRIIDLVIPEDPTTHIQRMYKSALLPYTEGSNIVVSETEVSSI